MKIRIQGKTRKEFWGNLESSWPPSIRRHKHKPDFSIKDAKRHAKLLSKIEKYKEDKIIEELKMLEAEKAKTVKLLRIKKIKERKRKEYLGILF